MSRRPPRVPGTPGRRRFEVATGGMPGERFLEAVAPSLAPGSLRHVAVRHDPGCPCLAGRSMFSCSCEIVDVELGGAA